MDNTQTFISPTTKLQNLAGTSINKLTQGYIYMHAMNLEVMSANENFRNTVENCQSIFMFMG